MNPKEQQAGRQPPAMTTIDLRVLCTALGFTAVVMQGEKIPRKFGALRATAFANLIEEFCRSTVPEAFAADEGDRKFSAAERMATAIAKIIKGTGGCLPQDLNARGFTPDEVDRNWAMAKALADVMLDAKES